MLRRWVARARVFTCQHDPQHFVKRVPGCFCLVCCEQAVHSVAMLFCRVRLLLCCQVWRRKRDGMQRCKLRHPASTRAHDFLRNLRVQRFAFRSSSIRVHREKRHLPHQDGAGTDVLGRHNPAACAVARLVWCGGWCGVGSKRASGACGGGDVSIGLGPMAI